MLVARVFGYQQPELAQGFGQAVLGFEGLGQQGAGFGQARVAAQRTLQVWDNGGRTLAAGGGGEGQPVVGPVLGGIERNSAAVVAQGAIGAALQLKLTAVVVVQRARGRVDAQALGGVGSRLGGHPVGIQQKGQLVQDFGLAGVAGASSLQVIESLGRIGGGGVGQAL
jgi:hypothetical protein